MREKVGKSRNTVFFQWFVAPEGRKVGSLKRRVRSQLATGAMKNCTPLWREAHFEVKMCKTPGVRITFGSWDVEKVHAVVARSTFRSQNVQNTRGSDHFWKLRCRKSAPTALWREAHFQGKMYKTPQRRTTFGSCDVKKVHAVVARSTFRSQNVQNTRGSDHFWKLRCRKSARCCGAKHISKSKCTKHTMLGPLLEVQMSLRFASPHYITLHYTPLHSTTLHYTTLHLQLRNYTPLHSTTLNYTTLHYTPLHSTTLHYITLHCTSTTPHYITLHSTTLQLQLQLHNYTTTLQYTPLHSTTLHYTTLHYITLHYTPLHYITLHYTTFHYTSLHYITLHYTPLHYNYNYTTTLHYTKLHYTTLHYITLHSTTLHELTLHYTTFHYTSLHYTTLHSTTRQLQLHNYTPLH